MKKNLILTCLLLSLVACDKTKSNPKPTPTVVQNVKADAPCSVPGRKGVTSTGTPMICVKRPGDDLHRWRAELSPQPE